MKGFSRRQFGGALAAGSSLAALSPKGLLARSADPRFPGGFLWGAATSAYQIEGAANEDGRGKSIWDIFSHTPGMTAHGATGDIACDSYHRFREDHQLVKDLGAKAYRFSVAWPRIMPNGTGKINQKGLDHYNRVVDDLLERGIEPHVTLFHWDLPATLPGGWRNRDTAKAFADYAGLMTKELSDRVRHFMTLNEIQSIAVNGHQTGMHAPGLKLAPAEVNQVRHHAVLAHGLGVAAIRANGRPGTLVGFAENASVPVPVIETEEHIEAARKAFRAENGNIVTAILEGAYPAGTFAPGTAPQAQPGDMATIGSAVDFVALNYYFSSYARAAPERPEGFAIVPMPSSFPKMDNLDWLTLGPEGLYWTVRFTSELWKPKAIYISENGAPSADRPVDGRIDDTDRVMFLRNYVGHLQRAAAEGYPVKGYFAWSLLDNFEWNDGYTKRFGIHYTDFATQKRIPKLSAAWYKELIRRNALV